jgi:hypothetical protein
MPRGGRRPGAGRPAGSQNRDTAASRAALADLVAGHVETAIATLAQIAKTGESEAARVSAATAILDRAYGRPGQAVEITDTTPERPTEIVISSAVWPISDEAEAEIEANRRPNGSIDFTGLSDRTLDQIMEAGGLRDIAQERFGA